MRGIQGSLIVASTLQIVVGFSGLWRNVARFLSPLSAVPLVALSGFGLYEFGFPLLTKCVEIGLPQIIFLVIFSQIYAHLLTVGGAYENSGPKTQISCRTDRAGIVGAAPWIRVPYPFQWGAATFDAGEAFAMMAASFVSLVESTGAFIAVSRYASATPLPPSILSRGVGWQGIGILFSGIFGTGSGSSFNNMINVPFSSEAFVAGILAFFLDLTLHRKDNATRKDRGMNWWDKFRSYKTDTRSEEFYSLPFNLNKFFHLRDVGTYNFGVACSAFGPSCLIAGTTL
ncbi:hypothetical protein GH714_027025 [Hevea brasiliensis]|uniref:Uncharacterized protein n=1 Tax=Hevea brasiliensis TaxID=3981 RepID=A0A6A6NJH1_HEVBR|nr:hypothetical protein GH714_027025 [Hevea brasiliensis]